jgi:TRAP-type C4-dicarboxylate transport system permease large subunit
MTDSRSIALYFAGVILGLLLMVLAYYLTRFFDLRKKEKAARYTAQFNARLDQVIERRKP